MCIFCKIIAKQIPGNFVYEDDTVVAFLDINPKAKVHVLIVPKKHIPTISEVKDDDQELLGKLFLIARDVAAKEGVSEGYKLIVNNGACAGQVVFHLHIHLLGGEGLQEGGALC